MPNRLASETSPYLRQHADNPVDWHAWRPEALALAKSQDKPILLSVGYAACHWCHVMAHESFEDEATAALMNAHFVSIKLDREERPDLDAIYQGALALMGEQGGWPLTMFLTPELKPFAGGTYFPPEPRYGRPSFRQVLTEIARVWREDRPRVTRAEESLMPHLQRLLNPAAEASPGELTLAKLDRIAERLLKAIDPVHGGVGNAPKFPNTPILELLWRAYWRTGDPRFSQAVVNSLTQMCQGGIYDHLGGGFARYSVDRQWLVPHFEKMLYDNAQLVSLLTLVWKKTKSPLFKARVEETVEWALREMRVVNPVFPKRAFGFASSLDADSEGHEGLFYVWSRPEILDILGTEEGGLFCSAYGVTAGGNFEGRNILNRLGSPDLGDEAHEMRLKRAREKLLAARDSRVRPTRDDKVLAEWNGLWIKALAEAGAAFGRKDWLEAAATVFRFVWIEHLNDPEARVDPVTKNISQTGGRLYRAWNGRPQHDGTAEDYANMIAAAIALFAATGDDFAISILWCWVEQLEKHFAAPGGAFHQTRDDAADILVRSRTIYDNAVSPANATMLANYARLHATSAFMADTDPQMNAERILKAFSATALQAPTGTAAFLNAAELLIEGLVIYLIAPDEPNTEMVLERTGSLARAAIDSPDPNLVIVLVADGAPYPHGHPAADKPPVDGKPTAYVCRGQVCSPPVTDAEELARLLRPPLRQRRGGGVREADGGGPL
ncbi:MAG: thioredoxin domain-containing protein [Alphaproteobacteria bacterium]